MNNFNLQRFGNGPIKLVAIHGLGSASSAWKLLQSKLDSRFELITLELPGHENSKITATSDMTPSILAEMVNGALEEDGILKFHLIGNSLGGWVALEMAAKFPNQVQSVTALAPAGLWLKPKEHRNMQLSFNRYLAKLTKKINGKIIRLKFFRRIGFQAVSPRWKSLSIQTCLDAANAMASATGYFEIWDATFGNKFDKSISANIPVTILFGDSDKTLPAKTSQEKSLAPSHCEWVVLPNTGHAPMWDEIDSVIKYLYQTVERA